MSTIVNGRGIIEIKERDKELEELPERISIEEYRNIYFTPEEEWNQMYNPKKLSIETLNDIEIKKRGKGVTKNVFTSMDNVNKESGPYYDPNGAHLHIWKSHKLISNLKGPQNPNIPYIQFTDFKPGTYCSICHKLNKCHRFVWNQNIDHEDNSKLDCTDEQINDRKIIFNIEPEKYNVYDKKVSNWSKLMYKVFYVINNDIIVYPITKYKSVLLWPWQMTPYKRFKMSNPDYKESGIFLNSTSDTFKGNYAYIA